MGDINSAMQRAQQIAQRIHLLLNTDGRALLLLEPIAHKGPFDFGDASHLKRGFERFSRIMRKRYTRSHPMYIYFYRSVFGLRGVLYRLRAQVDLGAIFEDFYV